MTDPLASWNLVPAKEGILDFVARACAEDCVEAVSEAERVAVFDTDRTLWV